MTDNRKAGFALMGGSLGGLVTMAIHPTAAMPYPGWLPGVAHSLALASVLLLLLGACGLTRYLAAADRLAFSALVVFAFAIVAVFTAAAISGFAVPSAMQRMARDVPEAASQWRIAMAVLFQLNQACSRIYAVATAAAIVLWSVTALRQRLPVRGFALYGLVSAGLVAVLIAMGHLRLNVHGMAVVMLSEVIWFAGMAAALLRAPDRRGGTLEKR